MTLSKKSNRMKLCRLNEQVIVNELGLIEAEIFD